MPISVDTTRAAVVRAGFEAGAVLGNDMSGFADPGYLPAAAAVRASVIATHIRLPPGVPDPDPQYTDLVGEVCEALRDLARRAEDHGLGRRRVVLDPGKTWSQSVRLLAAMDQFAASNKIFLGRLLGLDTDERATARMLRSPSGCYAAAGSCACTTPAARGTPLTWPTPSCDPSTGPHEPTLTGPP